MRPPSKRSFARFYAGVIFRPPKTGSRGISLSPLGFTPGPPKNLLRILTATCDVGVPSPSRNNTFSQRRKRLSP
jgi:hypothetical protein